MPRPRKVSDQAIFDGAFRVMRRSESVRWTLADVAAEVGLSPGALVQRFGSKRALQLLLAEQFADSAPEMFAGLRRRHPSPLDALRAYADCVAGLAESPETLAHHLDYLRMDLTDGDLHQAFRRHAETARAFIRDVLDDAVAEGELCFEGDTASLARQIETTITGSLMTWAVYREGPAIEWLRTDLEALLRCFADGGHRDTSELDYG